MNRMPVEQEVHLEREVLEACVLAPVGLADPTDNQASAYLTVTEETVVDLDLRTTTNWVEGAAGSL